MGSQIVGILGVRKFWLVGFQNNCYRKNCSAVDLIFTGRITFRFEITIKRLYVRFRLANITEKTRFEVKGENQDRVINLANHSRFRNRNVKRQLSYSFYFHSDWFRMWCENVKSIAFTASCIACGIFYHGIL